MEKREPENDFLKAVSSIQKIMMENNISLHDINASLCSQAIVPVSIFNSDHSPLGCLVVYLKNNKGLAFSEIAKLLHRDSRTIWSTYQNNNKQKIAFKENYDFVVPLSIFADRNFSIMESLVRELKEIKGLRFVDIAKIIGKNQKTAWCFYSRARKKCK